MAKKLTPAQQKIVTLMRESGYCIVVQYGSAKLSYDGSWSFNYETVPAPTLKALVNAGVITEDYNKGLGKVTVYKAQSLAPTEPAPRTPDTEPALAEQGAADTEVPPMEEILKALAQMPSIQALAHDLEIIAETKRALGIDFEREMTKFLHDVNPSSDFAIGYRAAMQRVLDVLRNGMPSGRAPIAEFKAWVSATSSYTTLDNALAQGLRALKTWRD